MSYFLTVELKRTSIQINDPIKTYRVSKTTFQQKSVKYVMSGKCEAPGCSSDFEYTILVV